MTTQTHRDTAGPNRSIRTAAAFAASIALGATAPSALATPVVDQWITQEGVISNIGSVTNVFLPNTTTNRHIIQWLSMNIGSGETMNFQGLSGYAVLNQVKTGMGRTEILGTLNALQGNVFLVNQAGVTFGAGSVVHARGITAAASSFAEAGGLNTPMRQAFMNNQAVVFNLVDTVTVEGAVDGGAAAAMLSATEGLSLLGTRVSNGGQLSGRTIVIAIGDQVIINDLDNPLSVVIDGKTLEQLASTPTHSDISGTAGDAGIHNTGTINATEGGSVSLAASDLVGLALAIHHEGEIVVAGGTADLLAGAGAVWTAGNDAGTGNLTEGLIDVSHTDGAGAIRMVASAILHEGTARAMGPSGAITLHAADNVVMLGEGSLSADGGLGSGHGGTINVTADAGTVWGEHGTAISTKGGLFGGDAGTIVVSGDSLNILSATKINANAGNNGSLSLSSAKDVTIDGTGAALGDLDTSDLSSSLLGEGEVGRIGAAANETLWYVDGDLAVSSDQTLRVEQSLINITSADRNWGFLGGDATFSGEDIRLKLGEVDGEFGTLKADNLTLDGHISLENHASLAADGTLRLIGGNIRGQSGVQHDLIASAGQELYIDGDIGQAGLELGNTSLTAGSSMHMLGATESSEVPGQFVHIDGDLVIGGLEQGSGGSFSLSAIEDVQGEVTGGVYVGSFVGTFDASFAGGLHVNAGGEFENYANITTGGDLYLSGASMTNVADLTSTNGAIELQANGTDPGQGVLSTDGMLSVATDLTLRSEATLTNHQSLTANGTITLESFGNDVINDASLTAGTGIVIAASQGSVQVNADVHAGQTGLGSTADVVITSGGNVDLASTLTATGAASVTGDSITTSGTVHAQGDVTMDATTTHLVTATGGVMGNTVTMSNGDITVSGTVDGTTSVAMSTSGDATISGDVQGGNVTVDASSIAVGQGGLIQGDAAVTLTADAAGTQQIDGAVTGDMVSMSNGTINVTGTVDGTTSVAMSTSGDATILGDVQGDDVTVDASSIVVGQGGLIQGDAAVMLTADAAGTQQIDGAVTGDMVSMSNGTINVTGTVDGTTSVAMSTSGDATILGDVQGDAVTVDASSIAVGQGGSIQGDAAVMLTADAAGTQQIDGAVTADMVSMSNGTINVTGTVDGTTSMAMSTSGDATISGDVQGDAVTVDASSIAVDQGGSIQGGVAVTLTADAAGTQQIDGAVTADMVSMSNGTINVTGTVDGTTSMAMSTFGDATISGDVQGGNVTVDASSIAVGQGGSIQGGVAVTLTADAAGTQQIDGDVTADMVSMSNGTINVTGTVDGATSVAIQTTDGDIVMDGSIASTGDVTVKTDNDSIDSSGTITGGTIKMTAGGDLAASGPLTAATSASVTGENVSLGVVTVNQAPQQSTGISVTANGGDINAMGNLTTTGVVEFTAMDGSILVGGTADAHGFVASGRTITNTGEVNTGIGGTAMVGSEQINIQNTLQSVGTITLQQSQDSIESMVIAADITGGAIGLVSGDLLLEAVTVKSTSGDIGVNASMITLDAQASIDSANDLRIGRGNQGQIEGFLQESDIQLAGNNLDLSADGNINLLSRVNATDGALAAVAGGRLFVGGNLGSDDALASLSLTASKVVLGGHRNGRSWTVDQVRADGDISLNGDDLATLSSLPTVYGFGDTLAIASNGGDITIGNHQGFSYLGDLTLDAGRELTVGDITALGDLTLRGATISVHRRAPGLLTEPTDSILSDQTSIVSGRDLLVSGQLQYSGTGLDPLFAGVRDTQGVPNRDRATTNAFQAIDMETTAGGLRRLTLRSLGAYIPVIPTIPTELIAAESHPGEEPVQLKGGVPDLQTQESLAALGIDLVESLPTPTRDNGVGRAGYVANDLPSRVTGSGRIMVTRHRLNASLISKAVAEYQVMQNESPVKGDFNSMGPLHHTAMAEYRAAEGASAPPAGLVAFLQEHPSAANDRVLQFETQLEDLYSTLSKAGLSSGEVAGSRQFVMQRLESAVPATGVAHHGSSPKGS